MSRFPELFYYLCTFFFNNKVFQQWEVSLDQFPKIRA